MDGGTRVEIQLSKDPRGPGGLLSLGDYSKTVLPLARLVAAVAPNLDVIILTSEGGTPKPIVHPGDWLKISDMALRCRLNPALEYKKTEERGQTARAMMRPISSKLGELYGRAFIKPERWSYGGWVTISGLRAQRVKNIEGVLRGEAINAARDTTRPLATKDALAEWATEQAHLIAKGIADEEQQALSARIRARMWG